MVTVYSLYGGLQLLHVLEKKVSELGSTVFVRKAHLSLSVLSRQSSLAAALILYDYLSHPAGICFDLEVGLFFDKLHCGAGVSSGH